MMKHHIDVSADELVFSTTKRLPFEPKGAALDARSALRTALTTLTPTGFLAAEFASADTAFCDLENVLLSNVGMGSFGALAARGLVLTRSMSSSSLSSLSYVHRYCVVEVLPAFAADNVVARVAFDLPKHAHTATDFWWLARPVLEAMSSTSGRIAVNVEVQTTTKRSLTALLKPLLDGVLSACHRHDGQQLDLVASRLSTTLQTPIDDVVRALGTGPAPLGVRRLVAPRADGVQWNPADDLVTHLRATMTTGPTSHVVVTVNAVERHRAHVGVAATVDPGAA